MNTSTKKASYLLKCENGHYGEIAWNYFQQGGDASGVIGEPI